MMNNTKLDEKLKGDDNFRAWKYRVFLILKENDLEKYVEEEVAEQEGDEAMTRHKKNIVREKRLIENCIKYHLILMSHH